MKKQPKKLRKDSLTKPWENRVVRFLAGAVIFVFFIGGVREVMQMLEIFVPGLRDWSGLCYILVVLILLGCGYCFFRDDYVKKQEMEQKLTLYRWEAEQLKEAADNAIRANTTVPLVGALRTIHAKEAEQE